ncbi:hypothetical protein V6N12_070204 [Hibiscus sabdariffa]|uniref:Uncharacterized protein n=1 Tax=Hibiscus sabdariffa TaxID=183260 RepID=A0ABR2FG35_9ROSI
MDLNVVEGAWTHQKKRVCDKTNNESTCLRFKKISKSNKPVNTSTWWTGKPLFVNPGKTILFTLTLECLKIQLNVASLSKPVCRLPHRTWYLAKRAVLSLSKPRYVLSTTPKLC